MSDPRFARLKTDPRFRRPRVKQTKVVIDERFKSVFEQGKSKDGPKVDKYGRPKSDSEKGENLRRYYRLANDAEDSKESRRPDLARGEVLLESSDEDEQTKHEVHEGEDSDEDGGFVTLGEDPSVGGNDEFLEVDLDEDNYADLDLQAVTYSKAYARQEKEAEDEIQTTRTSRLAIVNLDWDHVRAQHLYKICSSLVSPTAPSTSTPSHAPLNQKLSSKASVGFSTARMVRGHVRSVRVYPSDFGKRRIEREEKEGPPKEIFKKKPEGEINERTVYDLGDEEKGEYDEDVLRRYQLERLRYYYAIVECDTVEAATHIYNELEGTELERSANVFDLSFVPEGMTFEGEPRDEATEDLNTEYKPIEFVTDALRHSKVKLTWDDDDPERHHVTRRALTKKEIEEGDFRNYVGGSSSESSDEEGDGNKNKSKNVMKDKKTERDKLRALLLGGNEDEMPEGWGATEYAEGNKFGGDNDDVDMEITFMPALSKTVGEGDETTLEKYQRKVKEKRKKRKDGRETQEDKEEGREHDGFFEASGNEDEGGQGEKRRDKSARGKKRIENESSKGVEEPRKEVTAAELALLVAPDNPTDEPKHFSLKSVIKAEKDKKRKGKKGKRGKTDGEDNEAQEEFAMNLKDERFKALFEDHQFAVDPSNPHFKKTKAMAAILEERQRRRRGQVEKGEEVHTTTTRRDNAGGPKSNLNSLQSLVESVKRKSMNAEMPGVGKRRKL